MEGIRQAVERAKQRQEERGGTEFDSSQRQAKQGFRGVPGIDFRGREVELDADFLGSKRMIAYDRTDVCSRSFDVLRTQVLRTMDLKGWRLLAVTSPTPGCGKTLTAINLALSIARQAERQVLLVDMDLRKPEVASSLGIVSGHGLLGVLEEGTAWTSAIIHVRVGNCKLEVLPTVPASRSSDVMGSSTMSTLLGQLRSGAESRIIILDLPPVLAGDDVIAVLPQVDCILLVAAVGTSTISEIRECNKHLQSTDVVQFVLNKVPGSSTNYQYY